MTRSLHWKESSSYSDYPLSFSIWKTHQFSLTSHFHGGLFGNKVWFSEQFRWDVHWTALIRSEVKGKKAYIHSVQK